MLNDLMLVYQSQVNMRWSAKRTRRAANREGGGEAKRFFYGFSVEIDRKVR
jgi:hypothetical protein